MSEDIEGLHVCQLAPPEDYLSQAEFIRPDGTHREHTLTIAGVTRVELPIAGTSNVQVRRVLHFEGKKKGLVLGTKRNRMALEDAHGPWVKDWIGKSVTLYYDPAVKFGRKVTGGIRVRWKDQ